MKSLKRINLIQWGLIGGGMLLVILLFLPRPTAVSDLEISQVLQMAEAGEISRIQLQGDDLEVTTVSGETFKSRKESSVSVLELLNQQGVKPGSVVTSRSSPCKWSGALNLDKLVEITNEMLAAE